MWPLRLGSPRLKPLRPVQPAVVSGAMASSRVRAHGLGAMRWLRQNVFLFDGIGAIGSTTATLTIALALQPQFGMPSEVLWGLALLAVGFIAYSLTCWRRRAPLRPWLPIVMAANLTYCVVLSAALWAHASVLTRLGLAYFIGEIVIIVGVVSLEWVVLRMSPPR